MRPAPAPLSVVPNLEIMMTHAVYYWCNEHNERLTLSQEDLECVRKIHLKSADRNDNHGAGKSSADSTFLSNQSGKLSNGPDGYSGGDASEGNNSNWSDCGYDLLHDVESEIEKNQLREGANETCLQNIDEDHQVLF
ncbi:hypothetical protein ANCCEY_11316 [Ancylostoma ceylanicum]|uniref:Uncharacterized protein n=1 Tax=Ancylostoma ceylanicum TaxID=53326 RepID=A0A0D6LI37_9BILA|nr:hypothetical protein ANCCEY_11316 [Ancylostoma ceylanicum]